MTVGRNDPCPCGSGRKYKKCHLASDTAARAAERPGTVSPVHEQDQRLVMDILEFLQQRFPEELFHASLDLDAHPEMSPQFGAPWLAYIAEYEGRTGVDWFLEERGWTLARGAVEWLNAQKASWLSMWEVVDVEPGRLLVLRDLLTFAERTVHEVQASRTAERGMIVLCRVTDFGGVSIMCGMHPNPLRPASGSIAAESVRKALRRRNAVPVERLRNVKTATRMLNEWSDQLDALASMSFVNTEGDAILLTTDRWRIAPGQRTTVESRLLQLDGVEADDGGFVYLREDAPGDVTLIGALRFEASTMLLETISVARADELAARIEEACHDLFTGRRMRTHVDPLSTPNQADLPDPPETESSAEQDAILHEMKARHYRAWLDDPLPALEGKTPRAVVATAGGRRRVEKILQEIEMIEAEMPAGARFDVGVLRRELRIG